jgi:hypothetical protein
MVSRQIDPGTSAATAIKEDLARIGAMLGVK